MQWLGSCAHKALLSLSLIGILLTHATFLKANSSSDRSAAASSQFSPYQVLVHPDVDVQSLSTSELRLIFSQRIKQWPSGLPIRVVVFNDDSDVHQHFCRQSLNMMAYQLRRVWAKQLYTGRGGAPIQVNTIDEMLSVISDIPGAIGYLPNHMGLESEILSFDDDSGVSSYNNHPVERQQPAWKVVNVE